MSWWKRFKKWRDGEGVIVHCVCGEVYFRYDTLPGMIGINAIYRLTDEMMRHTKHFKKIDGKGE